MHERIKLILNESGMTQEEFAKKIGLSRNGVQKIVYGKNGISEGTIKLICLEFGVNRTWLDTGEGKMYVQNRSGEDESIEMLMDGESEFAVGVVKNLYHAWRSLDAAKKKALEDALMDMFEAYKKEGE